MSTKEEKTARRQARIERDRAMDEKLEREFFDPEKRRRHKRNVRIGWCVTLAILLVATLVNWGVITGWGKINIDRITIDGNDGAKFSALVYRPDNATDKTPAPAIMMYHGNAGNARNHESWAMEFARRGFVVVSIDQYGSGDSQGYFDGGSGVGPNSKGATGLRSLIDEGELFYEYTTALPFVDSSNILTSGHSMGSTTAAAVGSTHNAKGILLASPVIIGLGGDSDNEYAQAWNSYKGNLAVMMGAVELNGNTPEEKVQFAQTGKGKMPLSGALGLLNRYPGHENDTQCAMDTVYGSFAEGDGYVYVLEYNRIHEAAFVSTQTVGNLLEYGQQMVDDVPNYIDASNQVWPVKDYTGLFGIFAWAAFVFATALLLIEEVPAFAAVRRPLARNIGARRQGLVAGSLVALLVPYLVIKTDAFGIVGGRQYANLLAAGFNLGYSNMGFGVVIGLSICCTVGMLVFLFLKRKEKLTPVDFGFTPTGYSELPSRGKKVEAVLLMVVKSALVAALAVAAGFIYTKFQTEVFGTDFYSWFFGVKDLPVWKVPNYLNYLVIFIICFIVLSIDMNVIRRLPTTGSETKDLILAMAVNLVLAVTVIIIIVAVKWHLQTIGSSADTNWFWSMGLDTQRIWGLPVGMTVATLGATFLYKKTGNIWLCALLIGTIACLMGLLYGGTRFHYLTFFYN